MFNWIKRPISVAIMLICSASVVGADDKIYAPERYSMRSESTKAQEYFYHQQVLERTQAMVSLLAAEIALSQGRVEEAISIYLSVLRNTEDPAVAERVMDLAFSIKAYDVAQFIYQQWESIQTNDTPASRRLAWTYALISDDVPMVLSELPEVVAEANDEQRRRIFLQLAQMSFISSDLLSVGTKVVHKVANQYQDMPEAMIADVFFNLDNQKVALKALNRLAILDTEISSLTLLTLNLVSKNQPELLNAFFEQNMRKLSPSWRELQIDSLINSAKYQQAKTLIHQLLNEEPTALLYIQAAVLAHQENESSEIIVSYLDKAYQLGNEEQKTRAAMMLAMNFAEREQYDISQEWVNKITSPDFMFDKLFFQAYLLKNEGKWEDAESYIRQAENLPEKEGRFFTQVDLQRARLQLMGHGEMADKVLAEYARMLNQLQEAPASPQKEKFVSQILYQRGLFYADELRQPEKAIADFRAYLQINPDDPDGLNALGYTMLDLGNEYFDEAHQYLQQAYEKEPDSISINDSLGWAYYKKGDFHHALKYLEYAYDKAPIAEIAAHLGAVYWALGRQDEAKKVWRTAWLKDKNDRFLIEILESHQIYFE